MSRQQKALERLCAKPTPSDIKWQELKSVLEHLGYELLTNSGSRRKFCHPETKALIICHEPHPAPTADMDMERQVCRGKILFIDDVVTYEADSPRGLQQEFEAAVDDYVETCALVGKEPQKPMKGQFNVRIAPALHRAATLRACKDGVSLNEVVGQALDAYVNAGTTEVRHSLRVIVEQLTEAPRTLVSTASVQTAPTWQSVEVSHVHH